MAVPYPRYLQTGTAVNPAAPDGGNGPGNGAAYAKPDVESESWFWGAVHHVEHLAQAAYQAGTQAVHEMEDTAIRVAHVAQAIYLADGYAGSAIQAKIRMDVEELKRAFIPGLLMSLGILALTTLIGAAGAGLLAGVLSAGSLAVPAAIAGGEVGLESGFVILDLMGLGILLNDLREAIPKILALVRHAVDVAWNAGSDPRRPAIADVEVSARELAAAVAEMVNVVMQGILIWVLSKSVFTGEAKMVKGADNFGDPAVLAARGRQVLQELRARPAEVQSALQKGAAELASTLRHFKSIAGDLGDFVENKINLILKNVTEDAAKQAESLKLSDGGAGGDRLSGGGAKTPKEKPITEQSTAQKGVFGEAKADQYMSDQGFTKMNGDPVQIGDAPKGPGIDGVWKNSSPPPDYVISEAKYGSGRLGMTQDGRQMSDDWIDSRLEKALGESDADDVSQALNDGNAEKWLLKVDSSGNVTKTILP